MLPEDNLRWPRRSTCIYRFQRRRLSSGPWPLFPTFPGKLAVLKAQTWALASCHSPRHPPGRCRASYTLCLTASAPWPQGPLTALPNTAAWSPIFQPPPSLSQSRSLPFHVTCEIPRHASPFTSRSWPLSLPAPVLMCRPPLTHPSSSHQSFEAQTETSSRIHVLGPVLWGESYFQGWAHSDHTCTCTPGATGGGAGRGLLLLRVCWFLGFPRQGCLPLPSGPSSPDPTNKHSSAGFKTQLSANFPAKNLPGSPQNWEKSPQTVTSRRPPLRGP